MAEEAKMEQRIEVWEDGKLLVIGGIPLVRKVQVVSEHGEPLTWKKEGSIPVEGEYGLCRCGHSREKPFCDDSHFEIGFDGAETADASPTQTRQEIVPGGTLIVVKRDHSLCCESGFCGNRFTNIYQMTPQTDDTQMRAQVMAMVERCPSGSYVYSLEPGGEDVEPDLPKQIAVVVEITSEGPIEGPLWVTGGIPVVRSDGQPYETRNRVTLCNCGKSKNKPFCDGTHRREPNYIK